MDSQEIRSLFLERWNESLSRHANLFSSDFISGSSPPSVFVGSYNYPQVFAGPMLPAVHGDTGLLDSPEQWSGRSLEEIVNFRLRLVRGIRQSPVDQTDSRYIQNLQELAMSERPADADLTFSKTAMHATLDDNSPPFGPVGRIKDAEFSAGTPLKPIQKAYYDDQSAQEAVIGLYDSGVEISKIQKCFSIGMLGKKRRLVPTKWSITATDDIISSDLLASVLDHSLIDSCRVFSFSHLGNYFGVILFPRRWVYEMIEAWYSGGVLGFGSDHEDARGIGHPPAIAGAYFAAKLGVLEYLHEKKIQAGAVVLREIRPEYSVPVGVWQVREGIREAMRQPPVIADDFESAVRLASDRSSITQAEWLSHGEISRLVRQKTLSDYA